MTWFVQPLQMRAPDGRPAGLWRLVAKSDEGGGFVEGCMHTHHDTAEKARTCPSAAGKIDNATGFPSIPLDATYTR